MIYTREVLEEAEKKLAKAKAEYRAKIDAKEAELDKLEAKGEELLKNGDIDGFTANLKEISFRNEAIEKFEAELTRMNLEYSVEEIKRGCEEDLKPFNKKIAVQKDKTETLLNDFRKAYFTLLMLKNAALKERDLHTKYLPAGSYSEGFYGYNPIKEVVTESVPNYYTKLEVNFDNPDNELKTAIEDVTERGEFSAYGIEIFK